MYGDPVTGLCQNCPQAQKDLCEIPVRKWYNPPESDLRFPWSNRLYTGSGWTETIIDSPSYHGDVIQSNSAFGATLMSTFGSDYISFTLETWNVGGVICWGLFNFDSVPYDLIRNWQPNAQSICANQESSNGVIYLEYGETLENSLMFFVVDFKGKNFTTKAAARGVIYESLLMKRRRDCLLALWRLEARILNSAPWIAVTCARKVLSFREMRPSMPGQNKAKFPENLPASNNLQRCPFKPIIFRNDKYLRR